MRFSYFPYNLRGSESILPIQSLPKHSREVSKQTPFFLFFFSYYLYLEKETNTSFYLFISMEAGSLVHSLIPWNPKLPVRRRIRSTFPRFFYFRAFSSSSSSSSSSDSQGGYRGPKPRKDWVADWVSNNDDVVRSLPIYVGGASLLAVLLNRTVSGIAPVADASR